MVNVHVTNIRSTKVQILLTEAHEYHTPCARCRPSKRVQWQDIPPPPRTSHATAFYVKRRLAYFEGISPHLSVNFKACQTLCPGLLQIAADQLQGRGMLSCFPRYSRHSTVPAVAAPAVAAHTVVVADILEDYRG